MPVYFRAGQRIHAAPERRHDALHAHHAARASRSPRRSNLLDNAGPDSEDLSEVVTVFGKAGRAETSTDPAPFSMMETTMVLKPKVEWRAKERWYSSWAPDWLKAVCCSVSGRTRLSYEELITEMDQALQIPGNTNAWTMPIKGRIDMLTTGVRTPIGIKIFGADLERNPAHRRALKRSFKGCPGTRSVFAERVAGGYFVDFTPNGKQLARYGLSIDDLQMVIMSAVGGETITTTIEGRERYSINLRYPRELRIDLTSWNGCW